MAASQIGGYELRVAVDRGEFLDPMTVSTLVEAGLAEWIDAVDRFHTASNIPCSIVILSRLGNAQLEVTRDGALRLSSRKNTSAVHIQD